MSNVMYLNHFEEMWETEINKYDTSLDDEVKKIIDFIENTEIDKVIVTTFDYNSELDIYQNMVKQVCNNIGVNFVTEVYGYSFQKEQNQDFYNEADKGKTWVQGTRAHHTEEDVLPIEDIHRSLIGHNVYLAGSFEGQCVLDTETIFKALGVEYEKVKGLIVGDYCEYEFKGKNISEYVEGVFEKFEDKMSYISEKYDCFNEFDVLINNAPNEVENIIVELKDELEEEQERLLLGEFHVNTHFNEFSEILQDVFEESNYNYDEIMERIENAKELVKNTKTIEEKVYYHGTSWKRPTSKDDEDYYHDEINIDYNDNGAVYVSNSEKVAENFTSYNSKEGDVLVVMKVELEIEKGYIHSEKSLDINVFEEELTLSDREEIYRVFDNNGYDAFIIKDNYPEDNGDDIALFEDIDNIQEAKAFLNNEWTEYMDLDNLKELVMEVSLKQESKQNKKKTRRNTIS